jgi:hypothetical protein
MSGSVHRTAPASYIQRAMWINAQRHRKAALNVMVLGWRLQGLLAPAALRCALSDVMGRHEALRTRLELREGQLLQVVEEHCEFPLEESTAEGTTSDERWTFGMARLRLEAGMPIDISASPPVRAHLVRISDLDHVLGLFVHHAMCDGWSSQVIMRDLASFYEAKVGGNAAMLPELHEQYADFAQAQIRSVENGWFGSELAYWREELANPPATCELPTDAPRKGNRDFDAESLSTKRSPETLASLKEYARQRRVSLFSMTLAAFAVLIHRRTGVHDLLVGVSITNRWTRDALHMVGCLTNLLPARIRIDTRMEFDALVAQVHATTRRLLAYGKVPLEVILKETRGPLAVGLGLPLWCQVREAAPACVIDGDRLAMTPLLLDRGTILADLDVDLVETTSGLESVFAYRRSLFDQTTIAGLMTEYFGIVDHLARSTSSHSIDALQHFANR